MKSLSKPFFIVSFWLLGFSTLSAQNLVPLKLEVGREVPNIDFTATKLSMEYWLQIDQQFVALHDESSITLFEDDQGTDLIRLHQEAVAAQQVYVEEQAKKGRHMFSSRSEDLLPPQQAIGLKDTLGFKFIIDSWALPHPEATTIQLEGKLVYLVTDQDADEKSLSVACDGLGKETMVQFMDQPIQISEAGSSSYGDERFITYQLQREKVPVAVSKVEVYSASLELVSSNSLGPSGAYYISVKQAYVNQPVTLKFYYRQLEKKEYLFDQRISLGL